MLVGVCLVAGAYNYPEKRIYAAWLIVQPNAPGHLPVESVGENKTDGQLKGVKIYNFLSSEMISSEIKYDELENLTL
jgi:hypothetical protein